MLRELFEIATLFRRLAGKVRLRVVGCSTERLFNRAPRRRFPERFPGTFQKLLIDLDGGSFRHAYIIMKLYVRMTLFHKEWNSVDRSGQ